jgi:hypothetical protein
MRPLPFLARIERDNLIDDGETAWWVGSRSSSSSGLSSSNPLCNGSGQRTVYAMHRKADHDALLETLQRVAANPSDSSLFDAERVRAIDDPIEAVAWCEQRAEMIANLAAEQRAERTATMTQTTMPPRRFD